METDFGYSQKTIQTTGPFKPGLKNTPLDARIRVNTYADISTVPEPYVGMVITVLADENTDGTMKDYKVKSLKASALGIANSLIDEVVLYTDYLGVSGGGSNADLTNYYTKEEIDNKGYLTEHQDISTLATKSYVDTAIGNIVLESGNVTFRNVDTNEIFIPGEDIVVNTYGDIVLSSNSVSVNEGATGTFTVKLDKAPTTNQIVRISISSNNCTTDKNSLTFTSSNYSTPQTVTITGYSDSSSYTDKTDTITLSSTNVSSKTLSVTIVNTDVQKELSSISAVYNQGSTVVYPNSSLDVLKQGLTVTANYSDSTSSVITSYSLNGTLTEGNSTITVNYQGKTATFDVTVSALPTLDSITADYTQGSDAVYAGGDIDALKEKLIVTANYSDGNSVEVVDYTLSGELVEGTSTITVTYQGKTTAFDVVVSAKPTIDSALLLKIDSTITKEATLEDKVAVVLDHTGNNTVTIPCNDTSPTFVPENQNDNDEYIRSLSIAQGNNVSSGDLTIVMKYNITEVPINTQLLFDNKTGGDGYLARTNNKGLQLMDGTYLYLSSTNEINVGLNTFVFVVGITSKYGAIYLNGNKEAEKSNIAIKNVTDKAIPIFASPTMSLISCDIYNKILTVDEIAGL